MEEEVRKLPEVAADRRREHQQFFKKLKRKPPKNLDYLMQELHQEVFEAVDCLKCANCCKTTGPLFTDADIGRIARHLKLSPGNFIEQYLRMDEEGDYVLKEVPCPFLGADNYCVIYDHRPKACREYPHTDRKKFHQISALTLKNVAICPAAMRVVTALQSRLQP